MKWKEVTLGEIAEFKNGVNFSKENFGKGIKVFNVGDFKDRLFPDFDSLSEINPDGLVNQGLILADGDILFVRSNGNKELVGRSILIKGVFEEVTFSAFCIRCRFISEEVSPLFFLYLFRSDVFRKGLSNAASGTNINNLNQTILFKLPIPLPPLPTQKKIASILSAYDDQIENNLKRIRLLEEAAQNIYREWFVHYRFPGWENTEFVDGIPKGWEVRKLSDLAEFINGYAFKPNDHQGSGYPIIKIKECKNGIDETTPRNNGNTIPEKYFFDNGDIIFSWSASLDVYWWKFGKSLLNQHLFKVLPNSSLVPEYMYLLLKTLMDEFRNRTTGSTMQHIKRSELDKVYTFLPSLDLLRSFQKLIMSNFQTLENLSTQNQKLKEARDILLPRLMNGTIVV